MTCHTGKIFLSHKNLRAANCLPVHLIRNLNTHDASLVLQRGNRRPGHPGTHDEG